MLIVAGTITIDAAQHDRVAAAAAEMMAATHAEPGNLAYAFSFDVADPTALHVFERWESQAALEAHFATPHMAAFQAALREIRPSGADVAKYEISSMGPVF